MKKRVFVLFVALCMMLALAACGGPKFTSADFEGKWVASGDFNDEIKAGMSQQDFDEAFGVEDSARFLDVNDLVFPDLPMSLLLNSDGSCVLKLEDESKQIMADAMATWMTGSDLEGLFTELLTVVAESEGITFQDLYDYYEVDSVAGLIEIVFGAPMDELTGTLSTEMAAAMDDTVNLDEFGVNGTWEYKGGKIVITAEDGEEALTVNEDATALTIPANVDIFEVDTVFTRG